MGEVRVVTFFVLEVPDYKFTMLIYLYVYLIYKNSVFVCGLFKKNRKHLTDYVRLWINLFITFMERFAGIKRFLKNIGLTFWCVSRKCTSFHLMSLHCNMLGENAPHFTKQMVAKRGLTPRSATTSPLPILLFGQSLPHTFEQPVDLFHFSDSLSHTVSNNLWIFSTQCTHDLRL